MPTAEMPSVVERDVEVSPSDIPIRREATNCLLWLSVLVTAIVSNLIATTLSTWIVQFHGAPTADAPLQTVLYEFRAEPLEHARYFLFVGSALVAMPVTWLLCRKLALTPQGRTATWLRWGCSLSQVAVAFFIIQNARDLPNFVGFRFMLGTLVASVVLALWLVAKSSKRWLAIGERLQGSLLISGALAVCYTAVRLLPSLTFSFGRYVPPTVTYHAQFTMAEYAAFLDGATPLAGFYPMYQHVAEYFLGPIFALLGLTPFSYTAVMSLLSLLGMFTIFLVFAQQAKNKFAALGCYVLFAGGSFLPMMSNHGNIYNAFNYFAVMPGRFFLPVIVFSCVSRYLLKPSAFLALSIFFMAGLATMNNPEFGAVSVVAAIVTLCLNSRSLLLPDFRHVAKILLLAMSGVTVSIFAFVLATYIRSGSLPDFERALLFHQAFASYGYGMLPMPDRGLHFIVFATLLVGLGVLVRQRLELSGSITVSDRFRCGTFTFALIFAVGSLCYYVGRSHPMNLIVISACWLPIPLLTMIEFYKSVWSKWASLTAIERFSQIIPAAGACVFLLLLLGASVPPSPVTQVNRLIASYRESIMFSNAEKAALQTIELNLKPNDRVAIITDDCFELALKMGIKNKFPYQAESALVLRSQIDTLLNFLRPIDKIIVDPSSEQYPDVSPALSRAGFVRSNSYSLKWHRYRSNRVFEVWTRSRE